MDRANSEVPVDVSDGEMSTFKTDKQEKLKDIFQLATVDIKSIYGHLHARFGKYTYV